MKEVKMFVLFSMLLSITNYCYGCNQFEIYSECGNLCEPDCFNADIKACVMNCDDSTCVCKKGFYRSIGGKCLTYDQCTKSDVDIAYCTNKLGPNAMISPGPDCPSQTCGRKPKKNCGNLPGCICKPGFHLNSKGRCVNPGNC